MKKQGFFFAPLRVAGEFQIADAKVSVAANGDFGSRNSRPGFGVKRFNRRTVTFHDESVCRGDAVKRAVFRDFQNERVVEATGALQHGAAAGTTAVNGNSFHFASRHIDCDASFVGIANDGKMFARFPKAENFLTCASFTPVEQRLVARKIFGGRGERQVE
ncbi:MAG: hypothetical protein ABSD57_13750 [Verrucomicrobiota bacterium]